MIRPWRKRTKQLLAAWRGNGNGTSRKADLAPPRQDDEDQRAKAVRLVVLPADIHGAACGNCAHFDAEHRFCTDELVDQPVEAQWHCQEWKNAAAAPVEKSAAEELLRKSLWDEAKRCYGIHCAADQPCAKDCACDDCLTRKNGPPDEARDPHGKWTAGGGGGKPAEEGKTPAWKQTFDRILGEKTSQKPASDPAAVDRAHDTYEGIKKELKNIPIEEMHNRFAELASLPKETLNGVLAKAEHPTEPSKKKAAQALLDNLTRIKISLDQTARI